MPGKSPLLGQANRLSRIGALLDPAAVEGSDSRKRRAFWQIAQQIKHHLELLASLSFEKLDALRLEAGGRQRKWH